jgi:thiamine biosynthesis lipoprotein
MTASNDNYRFHAFDAMGTRVSFWVDRSAGSRAAIALRSGETFIRDFDRRLSRFRPDSELCRLNADPAETVEISTLMLRFLEAAVEAARISDGLIDPTQIEAVELAGYRESRAGVAAAPLDDAIPDPAEFKPAAADPASRWRSITLDAAARTVTRPPGLRIDSGGSGKGLAADLLAGIWRNLLPPGTPFIVDCGGDIRLGEVGPEHEPYSIRVETAPALPQPVDLQLLGGGVATSGVGKRIWQTDGGYAHHLIDPASGRPAWTGVLSATATAPTAQLAETAAKQALLGGLEAAKQILSRDGGLLVAADGQAHLFEPIKQEVLA